MFCSHMTSVYFHSTKHSVLLMGMQVESRDLVLELIVWCCCEEKSVS